MSKDQRNGQRKKRSIGSKSKAPELGYYYIVTNAEKTECLYMQGLRDSIPDEYKRKLVIKVTKVKTENLVKEAQMGARKNPQYAQPWIIFDRDQEQNFDKIIDEARDVGVNVGWSNPCIEIWFSAYFGNIPNCYTSTQCCDAFKAIYEKETGHTYKKSNKNIYNELCSYGNEEKAFEVAQQALKKYIKINTKPSEMYSVTTLHNLVKEIKNKTLKK